MNVDVQVQERGCRRLHQRISDIDATITKGIDHAYSKDGPPPVVLVVDSKYGTSQLNTLVDGTWQKSARWIEKRLTQIVDKARANEILDDGYSSVLA